MAEQPERPVALIVIPENIPPELKALRIWADWRYEADERRARWTKVPYTPFSTSKASSTRPSSWRTFDEAYKCYLERPDFFDGVFVCVSEADPFAGGDFDHTTDKGRVPYTYAELSPSGEGIRFLGRGTIPSACKKPEGELYDRKRFLSITGHRLEGFPSEILPIQPELDRLWEDLKGGAKEARTDKTGAGDRAALAASHSQEEWGEARRQQRVNISILLGDLNRKSVNNKTGRRDTMLAFILRKDYTGFHNKWPHVGIVRSDGTIDSSQIRAVMANSIKGRGFAFPQFVALMSHFFGHECLTKWGYNKQAVQEEFATLWFISRTPRTGEYKLLIEPVKRGKGSDHAALLERAYKALEDYKTGTQAFITQQDLADALGVHRRTAITLMQELRDLNRITYVAMRDNAGIVVSFRGVINSDIKSGNSEHSNGVNDKEESREISAPKHTEDVINQNDEFAFTDGETVEQPADIGAELEVGKTVGGVINAETGNEELGVANAQPNTAMQPDERENKNFPIDIYINSVSLSADTITPQNSLLELAKSYLDQPAEEIGERLLNEKTGAITYRRSAKHFAQLVGDEHQGVAAYKAEQERREKEESDAWKRFFMSLKRMTDEELVAYIGGGCKRSVAELARDTAIFDQHLYKTRLKCAKQHLEWRGLKMPERATAQKAVIPRKKEPKKPRVVAEQLELVEQAQPMAMGLIERLRQRKQEDTRGGSANAP